MTGRASREHPHYLASTSRMRISHKAMLSWMPFSPFPRLDSPSSLDAASRCSVPLLRCLLLSTARSGILEAGSEGEGLVES